MIIAVWAVLVAAVVGGAASTELVGVEDTATDGGPLTERTQAEQKEVMRTQLSAEPEARHGQTTIAPEAGTYLAGKMATLEAVYETNLRRAKLDSTVNESRRRAELLDGAARINEDITDLRSYHQEAYRSYRAGQIGEKTLVRRLMFVHMAAEGYENSVDALGQDDETVPDTSVEAEQRALKGDVLTMQGSVRSEIVASMEAGRTSHQLHTIADRNGTVLVSLSEDRLVREAYRDSRRTRGATPVDRISSYNRRAEELYSWIRQVDRLDNIRGGPSGDMVSVDLVANDDEVVSLYLNAVNKEVIREDARLDIENIPTMDPAVRSDGQMEVIVNRTYATGPLQVTLLDAETSEPIDGTIRVNNQSVGRTGQDGSLWTVQPPGESRLEATLGSRSLTITLDDQSSP